MIQAVPPSNLDAEQYVLGACLRNSDVLDAVMKQISPEDFYSAGHARVFRVMLDLVSTGKPVDMITVTESLRAAGDLEKVGGAVYVASLATQVEAPSLAIHYAGIVREKAVLRDVIFRCQTVVGKIYDGEYADAATAVQAMQQAAFEVAERGGSGGGLEPIRNALSAALAGIEERYNLRGKLPGLPTGLRDLDRLTGGLRNGDLVIVAARPSMGKSSLVAQVAAHNARAGKVVAVFTTEVAASRLAEKLLIQAGRLEGQSVRMGNLDEHGWSVLAETADKFRELQLFVDDHSHPTPAHIRSQCLKLRASYGRVDLVVVDYIGQLNPGKRLDSRVRELALISGGLKSLAKELGCPVLVASQLNRSVEARADKRPALSDLRDSGDLEQDADVVLLVHRPEFYDPAKFPGMAEIQIAKQREGPTGSVWVAFQKGHVRFYDLDGGQPSSTAGRVVKRVRPQVADG